MAKNTINFPHIFFPIWSMGLFCNGRISPHRWTRPVTISSEIFYIFVLNIPNTIFKLEHLKLDIYCLTREFIGNSIFISLIVLVWNTISVYVARAIACKTRFFFVLLKKSADFCFINNLRKLDFVVEMSSLKYLVVNKSTNDQQSYLDSKYN